MSWILHSKPWITEEDKQSVMSTLSSGMVGQGEKVKEFEERLANWVGATGAVATGSGASAVELALLTLGIKQGDEVILPTYVCPSVLEAILAVGAQPVLCDVGYNWVVEPHNVEQLINSKTKCIIVPHMYGIFAHVADFKKFGLPLIEDCAQAVGDKKIDCMQGDIAVFSFHPTKCFTAGEGGMIASKNTELLEEARLIRDGNAQKLSARLLSPMSDVQAALGLSQLSRYPSFLQKRREIAGKYLTHLAAIDQKLVNYEAKASSMFFRLPVRIEGGCEKYRPLFEQEKIHVRPGVDKLLHRMLGKSDNAFPVSVELFDTTVSVPLYPSLQEEEINRCLTSLKILEPVSERKG